MYPLDYPINGYDGKCRFCKFSRTQVGDSEDPLRWSSSYHGFVPGKKPTGMLSSVQSFSERYVER